MKKQVLEVRKYRMNKLDREIIRLFLNELKQMDADEKIMLYGMAKGISFKANQFPVEETKE